MAPMPISDAMFLIAERREQPMHVGGLELFRLPPEADADWVRQLYEMMIHETGVSTLFRRRPYRPPASMGAWSWQLDPDIDLEYHIRHSALPRPGRVRELLALASQLHGTLLDRQRPLWEAHVIEGLHGDRFAVYTKIHHALLDGVSALRLLEHALSEDADARDVGSPWAGVPERRSDPQSRGYLGLLDVPGAAWRTTTELAGLGPIVAKTALRTLLDQSSYLPSSAPKTILNVPITGARRFAAQSWPLEQIRAVAKAAGATINDVVLTMCSAALRRYLESLYALPDAPLVAMTPVSLRPAGTEVGGNAVGAVLCNLATDVADPIKRLEVVHQSMEDGKRSLRGMSPVQATAASAVALLPLMFSMMAGVRRFMSPPYNLVISNIPGPARPLHWNGAVLEGVYPLSIPADGQALNITCTSYHGSLEFGLTGCRRTVPHLQRLLAYLDDSLAELILASGA
jgi:WS/DGAT/MGAT family acyltransferase